MFMSASLKRHDRGLIATVVRNFLANNALDRAAYFYDFDLLGNRLDHLKEVFPASTLHAVAIKSQPAVAVLSAIVEQGHGLEAASFEEVELALAAGCPPERIVFDSPVKTAHEIARCCSDSPGMILNVNVLEELDRIPPDAQLQVGVRINPKVRTDAPSIYDVSSGASKFGVPIEQRDVVIERALAHPAVTGLHMHIGSEIDDRSSIVEAAEQLVELAETIAAKGKRLAFLDIGGGIAVRQQEGPQPGLENFYAELTRRCPAIAKYRLITEYGRFVHAHNGFVLSRIEYVLQDRNPPCLLTHVGADLFVREIYSDHPPHHDLFTLDGDGNPRTTSTQSVVVMGPLCFAGDQFPGTHELALAEAGDWLAIADCGANTTAMWSRHCSRTPPDWVSFHSSRPGYGFSRRAAVFDAMY